MDAGFKLEGSPAGPAAGSWHARIWPRGPAGPVAVVMVELIDWLSVQGYAPTTQRNHVRAAARLGAWMLAEGLAFDDLDAAGVTRMLRDDNDRHPEHRSANENMSAVLRFLGETGRLRPGLAPAAPTGPAQVLLARWLQFLEVEQGQGPSWIGKARGLGQEFLGLVDDHAGHLCWERVDVAMANDFLARVVSGYSASTAQSSAALLRGLLTWLADNGWIPDQISAGVLSPRRVATGLPKGLTAGEVAALKDAVDLDSPMGRRDLAIIVMLARLGIRTGEAAGLTLDHIDWREPSLRVVGKGGRVLVLPLPVDVGQTLVDYLRVRRADPGERAVFVRSLPPLRALQRSGISGVVSKHARRAGLDGVYAHRLRHTAACQVLAGGGTIRQVQELLGHANLASSMTYARVDTASLRALAPAWGRLP